jgi:hypothetical protein
VSLPKSCMYLSCPPYVPHALPISFFLIWSLTQPISMTATQNERFEVLISVTLKTQVFWDTTQWCLAGGSRRFGRPWHLHLQCVLKSNNDEPSNDSTNDKVTFPTTWIFSQTQSACYITENPEPRS